MKGLDEKIRAYKAKEHNQTIEKYSCEDIDKFNQGAYILSEEIISLCSKINEDAAKSISDLAYSFRNHVNIFCEKYFGIYIEY